MKRVQRVEDSLAQSGARSPSVLPAVSPRMRSHCARGTRWACNSIAAHGIRHYGLRRRDIASVQGLSSPQEAFRSPPGLLRGLRRNRHKETDKSEVNRRSPITAQSHENALKAIPTHGGIGTERRASRPVWRYAANSRRDRTQDISRESLNRRNRTRDIPKEPHDRRDRAQNTAIEPHGGRDRAQNIPTEPHGGRDPSAGHSERTARPAQDARSSHAGAASPRRTSPARTIPSAGAKTGQRKRRAGAQFTNR